MNPSTILATASIPALGFLAMVLFGHGYVNTIEWIAWKLKCHAGRVRRMHENRSALMNERWIRELERNPD